MRCDFVFAARRVKKAMWSVFKSYLNRFFKQWDDWVGDREMEAAIRQHLSTRGFRGGSAKLSRVRLVFVKRPGWLQIYQFDAETHFRSEQQQQTETSRVETLLGLVRLDSRSQQPPQIELFESSSQRELTLEAWRSEIS